jgi:hypothetical protein
MSEVTRILGTPQSAGGVCVECGSKNVQRQASFRGGWCSNCLDCYCYWGYNPPPWVVEFARDNVGYYFKHSGAEMKYFSEQKK